MNEMSNEAVLIDEMDDKNFLEESSLVNSW